MTPVKCAQHCPKGSRTLWGSLESQGPRGNLVILHQPGRAWELLDKKVIGETRASKASKERRGSPACLVAQLWRPSILGLLQGPKEMWAPLALVCLAFRGKLGIQGQQG